MDFISFPGKKITVTSKSNNHLQYLIISPSSRILFGAIEIAQLNRMIKQINK